MGKLVVRLMPGKLVIWSNAVDAPVSGVMDREHLIHHLTERDQVSYEETIAIVDGAERDGTSDPSQPLAEVLAGNRAGPNEEALDPHQIIARYT
jgi:hypothetical protein